MSIHCCQHDSHHHHDHQHGSSNFRAFVPAIISLVLLLLGIFLDYSVKPNWFVAQARFLFYLLAYLPVGWPVLKEAGQSMAKGDIFSEFFLMALATLGAFAIGEYPEGVAVMLFYTVGENFQGMAVANAQKNIKSLLDQRPDEVRVLRDGQSVNVKAKAVKIGEVVQLKPGEKLALDGLLVSEQNSFNTAALTGESKPDTKYTGDRVLAGMINLYSPAQVKVDTAYEDSKLSRLLDMIQHATAQKAPTELFIRKFARIYTPIIVFLALGIFGLPYFLVANYQWQDWLYRALIFLVVSCPCALVISIPLGYFGGIGAASRNGILFKGGNFLDVLAQLKHVVVDKTGTLTQGIFEVQEVVIDPNFNQQELLNWVALLESHSSHPIAGAIQKMVKHQQSAEPITAIEEIAGCGLKGSVKGKTLLVGNFKLLDKFAVGYDVPINNNATTLVAIAYDGQFAGYLSIADKIKPDAKQAIADLNHLGIGVTLLSGDKQAVVDDVAATLQIADAFGDLLPEDKMFKFKLVKQQQPGAVAFVGDGVNDAPVVALADVGMAMGGLGSDATIETADVVIQDDQTRKIALAIKIAQQTRKVVWQNIGFAFGVKAIVLILGAGGLATMWEAVFADVGVALLAVLNAVRIQRMKF